jgi:hypothetical protein
MSAPVCTFVVGVVFLLSGGIKALRAGPFIRHVFRYGLLPPRMVLPAAIVGIGLECALGVALMVHLFPSVLVPGTMLLLLGFGALTWWGEASGRIEDCGCYGGLLLVTPKQSVLLNLGYFLLLAIAWGLPVADASTGVWQILLTVLALGTGSTLGWRSQYEAVVDLSRLRVGKRWKARWLRLLSSDLQLGSYFVVFLSQECPYCKLWVPLLNVMDTQKDLPRVLGVMSLTGSDMDAFKAQHLVRFPLVSMPRLLFHSMTDAFPTAVLIEHGVITDRWVGEIPRVYFDRIRRFYESIVPAPVAQARSFGG